MQVMVIDMLEGFTRTGPLASPRVDALVPRQAECLRSLPAGSLVVFLADEHESDDFELKRFPRHCLRGTSEANIREELVDAASEAGAETEIVRKNSFSGFFATASMRSSRQHRAYRGFCSAARQTAASKPT